MQNEQISVLIDYAQLFSSREVTMSQLCTGLAFVSMLRTAQQFHIGDDELINANGNWMLSLKNLKSLMNSIEAYFLQKLNKSIRTSDINLLQIAKEKSSNEIIKLYEAVLVTLIEAPNKQDQIRRIMGLPPLHQRVLSNIIQSAIERRIQIFKQCEEGKIISNLRTLEKENQNLQNQVVIANKRITNLERELQLAHSEQVQNMSCGLECRSFNWKTLEKLQETNEILKQQIKQLSLKHENEVHELQQQIRQLNWQLSQLEDVEQLLSEYKQKYSEACKKVEAGIGWEKERVKLCRIIRQREEKIKQMERRTDELRQERYYFEEQTVYMKMEIERRDVQFTELSEQVQKKLSNASFNPLCHCQQHTKDYSNLSLTNFEEQKQENECLQSANFKLRELKKQSRRVTLQNQTLKEDKKRLEAVICSLSKQRNQQMLVLISAFFDFRQASKVK